jgi:hypothetical protein
MFKKWFTSITIVLVIGFATAYALGAFTETEATDEAKATIATPAEIAPYHSITLEQVEHYKANYQRHLKAGTLKDYEYESFSLKEVHALTGITGKNFRVYKQMANDEGYRISVLNVADVYIQKGTPCCPTDEISALPELIRK